MAMATSATLTPRSQRQAAASVCMLVLPFLLRRQLQLVLLIHRRSRRGDVLRRLGKECAGRLPTHPQHHGRAVPINKVVDDKHALKWHLQVLSQLAEHGRLRFAARQHLWRSVFLVPRRAGRARETDLVVRGANLFSSPAQLLSAFVLRVLVPGAPALVAGDGKLKRRHATLIAIVAQPGAILRVTWQHVERLMISEGGVR